MPSGSTYDDYNLIDDLTVMTPVERIAEADPARRLEQLADSLTLARFTLLPTTRQGRFGERSRVDALIAEHHLFQGEDARRQAGRVLRTLIEARAGAALPILFCLMPEIQAHCQDVAVKARSGDEHWPVMSLDSESDRQRLTRLGRALTRGKSELVRISALVNYAQNNVREGAPQLAVSVLEAAAAIADELLDGHREAILDRTLVGIRLLQHISLPSVAAHHGALSRQLQHTLHAVQLGLNRRTTPSAELALICAWVERLNATLGRLLGKHRPDAAVLLAFLEAQQVEAPTPERLLERPPTAVPDKISIATTVLSPNNTPPVPVHETYARSANGLSP